LGLLLGLALLSVASAAPPAIAQTEIIYLLGFIESSGCEFYRNGSWYDSKRAQAHLRKKYELLAAADQITRLRTYRESRHEKQPQRSTVPVRCGGGEAVTTNQWLRQVLARYRADGAA